MPLINADTLIANVKSFRILWLMGRPGSFKTSLAFRIAYELLECGFSRYLISNVRSPWRDDPEKVVLKDGKYADCVCVIDEGGLFLKTGHDAESFIAFTRKLNIVLLIPSYTPPTQRLRPLFVQRVMGLNTIGLPAQIYNMNLNYGGIQEKGRFIWRNPAEVFGCFDSDAMASDDGGMVDYVQRWTAEASKTTRTITKYKEGARSGFKISGFDDTGASEAGGGQVAAELSAVESQRRASESFLEAAEEISSSLSIFGQQSRQRGRKH